MADVLMLPLRADNLLALSIVALLWYLSRDDTARNTGPWLRPTARGLAALLLVVCFIPVGEWFLRPLENRFPTAPPMPTEVSGIIALGGGISPTLTLERGTLTTSEPGERLDAFVRLAHHYRDAPLIYTGGVLATEPGVDRFDARDWFVAHGIDPDRVRTERQSISTADNARNASGLVASTGTPERPWILVTSAFHMPRAVATFRKHGWHLVPWPVDYRTTPGTRPRPALDAAGGFDSLALASREWQAIFYYRLAGHTDVLIASPET